MCVWTVDQSRPEDKTVPPFFKHKSLIFTHQTELKIKGTIIPLKRIALTAPCLQSTDQASFSATGLSIGINQNKIFSSETVRKYTDTLQVRVV